MFEKCQRSTVRSVKAIKFLEAIPNVSHFSILTNLFNTKTLSTMGIKIRIQIDTLEAYNQ